MARLNGRMQASLRPGARETVRENLARAFGDVRSGSEISRMSREFFEFERVRALLLTLTPRMSPERLEAMFPFDGLPNLDRALEAGRGVMLLGSHLNSVAMFIAIMMLRLRGYEIGVALPEPGDAWGRTRLRRWLDQRGLGRGTVGEGIGGFYCRFNIRPIVRRLSHNEIVGQTGDGRHSAKFVWVDFLGRKLPFTTGSASIAQLTGASVVPMFQVGAPPDGMRFVIEEPFVVEKGSPADLEAKVAAYASRLEHHLRDNIPCWQHWEIPHTLEALAELPKRSLSERIELDHH